MRDQTPPSEAEVAGEAPLNVLGQAAEEVLLV